MSGRQKLPSERRTGSRIVRFEGGSLGDFGTTQSNPDFPKERKKSGVAMPRFHFKTTHGSEVHDDPEGMELKSLKDAWKEATTATGEILKAIDGSLQPEREWRMDVTNDAGQALFSLRLIPETYVEGHKLKEG
jgi:hypothetical protein